MRIGSATGFVLLLALLAPVFAAEARAQSFLGEWTATAETPGGGVSETLTVVKTGKGYAITAELVGADEGTPTAGPGTDIVLEGDRFSYKRNRSIDTPNGPLDRYAAQNENFVLVAPRQARPHSDPRRATRAQETLGNQPRAQPGYQGPSPWLVLTYTGVVSGETFKGTADLAGFTVPYTGVRVKR